MQGGVFFDEEFNGYFDVTAEIEELFTIFEFWVSSQVPEYGQNSEPACTLLKKYFLVSNLINGLFSFL